MACTDCFNNCPDIVSDLCVQYTGPSIPALGICQGDQLSKFEAQIVQYLLSALDGTGILPADVTLENCPALKTQLGETSPTLNALLQLLINSNCTLMELVADIQAEIAAGSGGTVWDLACLTGLPAAPTSDQILQATVNLACNLNSLVLQFPSTYVQLTDLTSLITPIVQNIITQSNGGVAQQNTKMVPMVAYEYYGSLSNFDAGGIGITGLGYQKVYICNGTNGTPDRRGRTAVGAVKNVPGPALDAAVDPIADPNNPNWNVFDKAGENFHKLTVNEIPSHSHGVTDPGHQHGYNFPLADSFSGNNYDAAKHVSPETRQTTKVITGITIQATGGSQGHITYQPSIAANFIMYIP